MTNDGDKNFRNQSESNNNYKSSSSDIEQKSSEEGQFQNSDTVKKLKEPEKYKERRSEDTYGSRSKKSNSRKYQVEKMNMGTQTEEVIKTD